MANSRCDCNWVDYPVGLFNFLCIGDDVNYNPSDISILFPLDLFSIEVTSGFIKKPTMGGHKRSSYKDPAGEEIWQDLEYE